MSKGGQIIGTSKVVKDIIRIIGDVAKSSSTVLVQGESGTGKELVAKAIHEQSDRASKPFIIVNCAAIPDSLLESEMFGHEKGSFTGAVDRYIGKFEAADSGTIFLDEIGTLSPLLQAKLLRVVQEKEIQRVGSNAPLQVNVRIISATNADLKQEIKSGKFREDLFYRLNVIPVYLAPLRERKEDVPLLIDHFMARFNREMRKDIKGFDAGAMEALISYSWPGNVRELQNIIERVMTLHKGPYIKQADLPAELTGPHSGAIFHPYKVIKKERSEKDKIMEAMKTSDGNRSKAAKLLGMHRNTLHSKLKEFGIDQSL